MKRIIKLSVLAIAVAFLAFTTLSDESFAQTKPQMGNKAAGFVDANGDGYNDKAPDADGDGIPNGLDPDYKPLNPDRGKRFGFVDQNGDGINDRIQDADGDGIRNCQDSDYVRPQDGTGNKFGHKVANGKGQKGSGFKGLGPKAGNGTGVCDGTGPKGQTKRNGR
ncbi:MAG: hypothetical protein ONB31_13865 [candidate division KSB1 bacterium]|nr:hypothetical protein [candidate division KSB1 bacterium]MDZ7336660.1 hypothetical protein [candidate division KSB1 bacterium]MDZ7359009.1 hypothetical protein [candidate division KSB1 bacterium]MDZ7402311.1 hypothetical protein [candidate division KSB1 bacterium]